MPFSYFQGQYSQRKEHILHVLQETQASQGHNIQERKRE